METKLVPDRELEAAHAKYGVPPQFRECHIALIGRYVIEGHVPVESIERLLREKPPVMGLVAPGMPAGSPGMESPNARPYDVLTFDRNGRSSFYERRPPRSN